MQTVGNYLKEGREAQNISLSYISDSTKISKIYLDWLEKDDYTKLPEGPYIKGYISAYAIFLGINGHEVLKRYDLIHLENNNTGEIQPDIPEDRKRPTFPILLLNKKICPMIARRFVRLSFLAWGLGYQRIL